MLDVTQRLIKTVLSLIAQLSSLINKVTESEFSGLVARQRFIEPDSNEPQSPVQTSSGVAVFPPWWRFTPKSTPDIFLLSDRLVPPPPWRRGGRERLARTLG